MEPMIYKPGAYNTPGVYKGAGGVYNGRGVYNDGAGGGISTVEIGGISYGVVKIGSLLWTTENLRNETEGSMLPQNPTLENGRLYKPYYFSKIDELLQDGWRIPLKDDLITLQTFSTNSNDFISVYLGGNDIYGLNLYLPGYYSTNSAYVYVGTKCLLWSDTQRASNYHWDTNFTKDSIIDFEDWSRGTRTNLENTALSIRLCKDA